MIPNVNWGAFRKNAADHAKADSDIRRAERCLVEVRTRLHLAHEHIKGIDRALVGNDPRIAILASFVSSLQADIASGDVAALEVQNVLLLRAIEIMIDDPDGFVVAPMVMP